MYSFESRIRSKLISLAAFSIAMGFLEAMVVVYLRQIYYPAGFSFPLRAMSAQAVSFESLREISTLIMLVSVGMIADGKRPERTACVLYCFGIWDIFYYVWLKVLLGWPPSLFTWDILFLIPVIWSGPVLAPIICSLSMVVISLSIWRLQGKGHLVAFPTLQWVLLSIGAVLIFLSFVWDYGKIVVQGGFLARFLSLGSDPLFQKVIAAHVPGAFNWNLFLAGEGCVLISIFLLWNRMPSSKAS